MILPVFATASPFYQEAAAQAIRLCERPVWTKLGRLTETRLPMGHWVDNFQLGMVIKPSYCLAGCLWMFIPRFIWVGIDTSPNTIQLRLSSPSKFSIKSRFDFSETNLTKISESLSMVPEDFWNMSDKTSFGPKNEMLLNAWNLSKTLKIAAKTASCPPFFFMASGKIFGFRHFLRKLSRQKTVDHPLVLMAKSMAKSMIHTIFWLVESTFIPFFVVTSRNEVAN